MPNPSGDAPNVLGIAAGVGALGSERPDLSVLDEAAVATVGGDEHRSESGVNSSPSS